MFEKRKLKKKINVCKLQIEQLEAKRVRSQAALVSAILNHETPSDADVDFFNNYTAQIDELRAQMLKLRNELTSLDQK